LDTKVFQDCLGSGKHAQDVERDYQAGVALGVTGTPTFFINGRLLAGAQPLAAFSAVIDAELRATPAPTAAS
jgi:protein-disulfide isomerase